MENGRYFAVTLDPGKHTFRSNDAQSGVELELKAGQDYFVRVEIAAADAPAQPKHAIAAHDDPPRGQPLTPESSVTGVTLSDGSAQTGGQDSLAEAARMAKLKKKAADGAPAN